jgi:hypothetical protein
VVRYRVARYPQELAPALKRTLGRGNKQGGGVKITEREIKRTVLTIQERFEAFDKEHPEVYAYLVALAFELYRKGFHHYGLRCPWERMRWHFQVTKKLGEEFKLNDHFPSRYARKIMTQYPELDGLFEIRKLRAA